MSKKIIGVVGALLVVGLIAVAMFTLGVSEKHQLTGTMVLIAPYPGDATTTGESPSDPADGEGCSGSGSYIDIQEGMVVSVRNDDLHIIASGELRKGTVTDFWSTSDSAGTPRGGDYVECTFDFSVSDIPASPWYAIELAHRGDVRFSSAQLQESGWDITTQLGDTDS